LIYELDVLRVLFAGALPENTSSIWNAIKIIANSVIMKFIFLFIAQNFIASYTHRCFNAGDPFSRKGRGLLRHPPVGEDVNGTA